MNRKMMLVLVAVVATVLPAVAVADVLVVGFSGGTGHEIGPAFYVQPGSNYMAASEAAGFKWTPDMVSSTEFIGNMTIGYMTNETIYEVNVLDINFTSSTSGTFMINITVTNPFPEGSYIYFSTSPFASTAIPAHTMNFTLSSTASQTALTFSGVHKGETIYVAFVIGSGAPSTAPSFTLTMSEAF
ncbi:hypothetical protein DMB44_01925 [Thermoplasma sp. Kam2015]|uniref:hypothetical protein n=1 Tax=Thermoplasma sp. Kam2015 TaxID=2094122 RepID=UPI000D921E78|nr:hypothetical protein [Thermoplasma sp. Kam2015]PYB68668.1 hypothetical protein DMB44_01925 [Thermoplasma sp. Kam2015]